MSKEVNIKINVDTGDATTKVKGLGNTIEDVGNKSVKSSDKYSGSIRKSNILVERLNSATGGLTNTILDFGDAAKKAGLQMKSAFIATGVGALIVALGLIVAYWDEISDAIHRTTENLEKQLDVTKSVQSNLSAQLKTIDKQIELGKKQGKINEELEKQKVAILVRLQEQNKAEVKILENQLARLEATSTEVGFWDSIAANVKFSLFGVAGLADEAQRLSAERLKTITDLKTEIENAKLAAVDLELSLFNIANPETEKKEDVKREKQVDIGGGAQASLDKQNEDTLRARESLNQALLEAQQRLGDEEVAIAKLTAEQKKNIEENLKNAKIAIAQQTLGNLGALAKEGSALAKGIAVSQATINTFQGVTSALSATSVIPDPFGAILKFANAAAIGIAGFINVKKILATKPVSTSAPGGGSGGGAPKPPAFNLVQGTKSNQIADSVQSGTQPVKAYVTSKDVTSRQEMDRNIEGGASL